MQLAQQRPATAAKRRRQPAPRTCTPRHSQLHQIRPGQVGRQGASQALIAGELQRLQPMQGARQQPLSRKGGAMQHVLLKIQQDRLQRQQERESVAAKRPRENEQAPQLAGPLVSPGSCATRGAACPSGSCSKAQERQGLASAQGQTSTARPSDGWKTDPGGPGVAADCAMCRPAVVRSHCTPPAADAQGLGTRLAPPTLLATDALHAPQLRRTS